NIVTGQTRRETCGPMCKLYSQAWSETVSINGSGEIVEGGSVTLSCSSDANPPALNFSWFKGGRFVGSGRIYSISKISSDHSGEYKCKSRNKHGEKYSDAVTLNVMYPPKNVSVSITGSGEIVEGDSVTLSCSSDANPPAWVRQWQTGMEKTRQGQSGKLARVSRRQTEPNRGRQKSNPINSPRSLTARQGLGTGYRLNNTRQRMVV
uniref:Ig-like domain-containing protein n=1 Tax=Sinocyclocheilus grahami TaxID=75366 RepID=A0A672M9F9_SINGR